MKWFKILHNLKSIFTGEVKEGLFKQYPSPANPCKEFYICVFGGTHSAGTCPVGTFYDKSLETCQPIEKVPQCTNQTNNSTETTFNEPELSKQFVDGDVGAWRRYRYESSSNPALWGEIYNEHSR